MDATIVDSHFITFIMKYDIFVARLRYLEMLSLLIFRYISADNTQSPHPEYPPWEERRRGGGVTVHYKEL